MARKSQLVVTDARWPKKQLTLICGPGDEGIRIYVETEGLQRQVFDISLRGAERLEHALSYLRVKFAP